MDGSSQTLSHDACGTGERNHNFYETNEQNYIQVWCILGHTQPQHVKSGRGKEIIYKYN